MIHHDLRGGDYKRAPAVQAAGMSAPPDPTRPPLLTTICPEQLLARALWPFLNRAARLADMRECESRDETGIVIADHEYDQVFAHLSDAYDLLWKLAAMNEGDLQFVPSYKGEGEGVAP